MAAVAETVVEVEVVMEEAAEAVAAAVEALVEVAVFSDSIAKFCLSNSGAYELKKVCFKYKKNRGFGLNCIFFLLQNFSST